MPWKGSRQVRAADWTSASRGADAADPKLVSPGGGGSALTGTESSARPSGSGTGAFPDRTPAVTVGVLALQGAVREHLATLERLGVRGVEVRRPADLAGVDGLIIPGGESTAISMLIDSAGLREPLQERLDEGMPAFGTCAGMILLSRDVADGRPDQHFFAAIDIEVRRNAFGRQVDSFETDLAVNGLDTPLHAVFIRAPVVEGVGAGVEVLATVDGFDGGPRPVVCREGGVLVAAFHPELTADTRLHRLFVSAVREAKAGGGGGARPHGAGRGQDDGEGEAAIGGAGHSAGPSPARPGVR